MTALPAEITIAGLRERVAQLLDARDKSAQDLADARDEIAKKASLYEGARRGWKAAIAERDEARAAIDRVRALHKPVKSPANTGGITYCLDCSSGSLTGLVEHPCGTIRALDGGGA